MKKFTIVYYDAREDRLRRTVVEDEGMTDALQLFLQSRPDLTEDDIISIERDTKEF